MAKIVPTTTSALQAPDFTSLMAQGWGDSRNSALSCMTWFKNRLYCGTTRTSLCLLNEDERAFQWRQSPVPCDDSPEQQCAEIHSFGLQTQQWNRVFTSPLQKRRGRPAVPAETGYTCMQVWQGESDDSPALYVGTLGFRGGAGARLLRSVDGKTFEAVNCPDPGRKGLSAVLSLVPFNGALFATLSNTEVTVQAPDNSPQPHNTVFVNTDPLKHKWQAASQPGFGEPWNTAISAMAVFNDYLYAATHNPATGFQVWKTAAQGAPPYDWACVLHTGAYRQHFNRSITAMTVFNQALYLGTGVHDSVSAHGYRQGVAGAEILRLDAQDQWQLVVGASRLTPRGFIAASSGLKPGFNQYFNRDIRQLVSYNGCLYAGTFNWASFLPYIDTRQWSPALQQMARAAQRQPSGFGLWCSADGQRWRAVTQNGFGNPYHCGVDTLLPSTRGLFVGSLNPFGPELADTQQPGVYQANPQAGAELWLGQVKAESPVEPTPTRLDAVIRDPRLYDWEPHQLRQLQARINLAQHLPAAIQSRQQSHPLTLYRAEHLPANGPMLLLANHPGIPLLDQGTVLMEDTLLLLAQLGDYLQRPVRYLANLEYYAPQQAAVREVLDGLGYVPNTHNNALHLLNQGEVVLLYPEGKPSKPGYQLRPFQPDWVSVAWNSRVPLVPVLLFGPHERQLLVEHQGEQVIVNKAQPLAVEYALVVMKPLRIRAYIQDINNSHQVSEFCTWLQNHLQTQIEQEVLKRPLVRLARQLQSRFGGGE